MRTREVPREKKKGGFPWWLLLLGFIVYHLLPKAEAPPANFEPLAGRPVGCETKFAFVLDGSPSMTDRTYSGGWEMARNGALQLMRYLNEDDSIGIVVFQDQGHSLTNGFVSPQQGYKILQGFSPSSILGGGTSISAGLLAAQQLNPDFIVLLSDGGHNTGPNPTPGVTPIYALTYPGDHDTCMRSLGEYYYAPDSGALQNIVSQLATTVGCQ